MTLESTVDLWGQSSRAGYDEAAIELFTHKLGGMWRHLLLSTFVKEVFSTFTCNAEITFLTGINVSLVFTDATACAKACEAMQKEFESALHPWELDPIQKQSPLHALLLGRSRVVIHKKNGLLVQIVSNYNSEFTRQMVRRLLQAALGLKSRSM